MIEKLNTDIIGGFPYADPNCKGCGKPLAIENAWMTDGCPCNSELGINSMNETRWRMLMQLQQRQSQAAYAKINDDAERAEKLVSEGKFPTVQQAIEAMGSAETKR